MVGVSALCLPPTCKSHPGKTPLPRIRQRHAKQPDKPRRSAHLDRERNRRWAEHCRSVKQKGAKACFMVPRWNASAHACRGKCDRASTDEWSPTKASGSALTYSEAGLFLDDTVPDMSDQWCPAYFKRFKLQIGNILKETCSLPDGDRHDVEP